MVGRLHEASTRHNDATRALEVGFARMARQEPLIEDDGLGDVPTNVRRGLRRLETKREG